MGVRSRVNNTRTVSLTHYNRVSVYLQTNTSTGSRVLGVMIQGATLNTTVSV